MEVADVKRPKALELENSRLKKLLAECQLDIEVLKGSMQKSGEPLDRADQGALARGRGLSLCRACTLIGVSRATPSYAPRLPAKDPRVVETMKESSACKLPNEVDT